MSAQQEPEWVELETILILHAQQLAEHGGIEGIRDEGLLQSALSRPLSKWDYERPSPDLCTLAASYAFGIARNHPFFDGNKRTAAVACETFLILNGLNNAVSEDEKYPIYLGLATGEISEESFAAWLRKNATPIE